MSAMTQPLILFRKQATSLLRDYAELMKLRVTTLIVMTAWCGYYFGAQKAGVSSLSWGLLHALLGIGLVSSGTAALNEVMEHKVDGQMRRTAQRPLPAGRMSLAHATTAGLLATLGGSIYLAVFTNPLTGLLTFLTSVVYLAALYALEAGLTDLHVRGRFSWSYAWSFRLDGGARTAGVGHVDIVCHPFCLAVSAFFLHRVALSGGLRGGGIRMLPVVEEDGRSTARRIVAYSLILIPLSVLPSVFGMAGKIYLVGAVILGVALFYFGARLAFLKLPINAPRSKMLARHVLQATVIYLPLLFALMMGNSSRPLSASKAWRSFRDLRRVFFATFPESYCISLPRIATNAGYQGKRRARKFRVGLLTGWCCRPARTHCSRSHRSGGRCSTTMTSTTASMTAYSATSCPSSFDQSLNRRWRIISSGSHRSRRGRGAG